MYPVKRFSRPVRGTWKNRGPVFSAFLFFTNPILYSFSRYPPFFLPPSSSPPSVSPRFLPLVDGKGENLAGEWKGEESVHMCVCVCVCVYMCGVEGASDDRWIFRKDFTKLRVSSVFLSPLLPFLWFMNELKYTRTPPSIIPSLFYLTRRKDIEDRF